jgi:hypothetical protein
VFAGSAGEMADTVGHARDFEHAFVSFLAEHGH